MRKFTKSLLTLALLVFAMGEAKAEKVYADLSQYGAKWDGTDVSFSWTATYGNQLTPSLETIGLPKGNLSSWQKLVVVVDKLNNCDFFRVLVYSGSDSNHSNTFKCTKTGANEFILSGNVDFLDNVTKIVLSGSNWEDSKNSTWGETPASFKVKEVYLERPDDPLAIPKDNLTKAISLGNLQNSFAKTTESWTALQTAISDGETELANASATLESLNDATTAINNAIAGLKLEAGYVNLTKAMFHQWTGIEDDATITGDGNCALVLNTSIDNGGMLYGNSSVLWNQYAKIVNGKNLIMLGTPKGITFGARTDRLEVGNGGGDANGGSLTTINLAIDEDGKAIADISSNASIRINAIKNGWGGPAVISDLLVEYKPIAVSVGSAGYATFSSEQNAKVAGTKAYAAKVNGDKVSLIEVTEIPAGSGAIVVTEGNYEFPVLNEAAAIANNDLLVSNGTVVGDGTIYVLANKNSVPGFYKLATSQKVPAGKAYLKVTSPAPEFLSFDGNTTGIESVKTVEAKGEFFNLAGQRVAQPTKGLYIVNGKKVVLK